MNRLIAALALTTAALPAQNSERSIDYGFELRVRNENWDNLFDFSSLRDDQRSQIRYRARTWMRAPLHHNIDISLGLDSEANQIVLAWHRHHQPCVGHRFSIGVVDDNGVVRGAAIIGRPVARLAGSPREVLEVTRLVSDGTPNACSMLYAAAARAGKTLGFTRIQTYILDSEIGTTLRASGWVNEGSAGGGQWKHTDGKPRREDQPTGMMQRWSKDLGNTQPEFLALPSVDGVDSQESLWD